MPLPGGADTVVFGGQTTPSQERSRHLKSGARGFRLVARLSHMRPPQTGQLGVESIELAEAAESSTTEVERAAASPRFRFPSLRSYASCGSSRGLAYFPSPSTSTQFC